MPLTADCYDCRRRRAAVAGQQLVAIVDPRAMFADAPDGPFSLNVLIDRVSESGRLFGMRMDGTWFHVGTPTAIDEAERVLVGTAA